MPTATSGSTQPSDYTAGTTLTGSLGGNATVLAGSGNSYLIVGGDTLNIPWKIISDSNGNTGTLVAFVAGDLVGPNPVNGSPHGLEISSFLKGPRSLVLENINGFAEQEFMRSSPTLLNIKHTAPFGLSGEFPTLQEFSAGAVAQHFTRSLQRVADTDFRNPTGQELDALTAFQETVLTVADENFDEQNNFDRFVSTEAQKRGRTLFFGEAKCSVCHSGNVLASSNGDFGTTAGVNENFNTGVASQQINVDQGLPTEQDIGQPGNSRLFNTPPLMGIRDTAPFFHESSAATLLAAVQFYDSPAFRASPAFAQVGAIDAVADAQNAADIVAFLESLVDAPADQTRDLDFGSVGLGATPSLVATVTNTGQQDVTVSGVAVNGANAAEFSANSAGLIGTVIAPGGSVNIDVSFSPVSGGAKTATLELALTQSGDVYSLGTALQAVGLMPQVSIVPASTLDFGMWGVDSGASSSAAVVISNTGGSSLSISNITFTGLNATDFAIASDSSETQLVPGASRTLNITFDPAALGQRTANLEVATNDLNSPSTIIALTGEGVATPVLIPNISATPGNIDYPEDQDINNKVAMPQTVEITNEGNGNLEISGVTLTGPNANSFVIVSDTGESVLAPAETRTIVLDFSPSEVGSLSATLSISSNDPDSPTVDIPITGDAVQQNQSPGRDSGGGAMNLELLLLIAFLLMRQVRLRQLMTSASLREVN